jgi:hypothetical protein
MIVDSSCGLPHPQQVADAALELQKNTAKAPMLGYS